MFLVEMRAVDECHMERNLFKDSYIIDESFS